MSLPAIILASRLRARLDTLEEPLAAGLHDYPYTFKDSKAWPLLQLELVAFKDTAPQILLLRNIQSPLLIVAHLGFTLPASRDLLVNILKDDPSLGQLIAKPSTLNLDIPFQVALIQAEQAQLSFPKKATSLLPLFKPIKIAGEGPPFYRPNLSLTTEIKIQLKKAIVEGRPRLPFYYYALAWRKETPLSEAAIARLHSLFHPNQLLQKVSTFYTEHFPWDALITAPSFLKYSPEAYYIYLHDSQSLKLSQSYEALHDSLADSESALKLEGRSLLALKNIKWKRK